jgi:hypothetical protein
VPLGRNCGRNYTATEAARSDGWLLVGWSSPQYPQESGHRLRGQTHRAGIPRGQRAPRRWQVARPGWTLRAGSLKNDPAWSENNLRLPLKECSAGQFHPAVVAHRAIRNCYELSRRFGETVSDATTESRRLRRNLHERDEGVAPALIPNASPTRRTSARWPQNVRRGPSKFITRSNASSRPTARVRRGIGVHRSDHGHDCAAAAGPGPNGHASAIALH